MMIHEILISLSGYSSPLFDRSNAVHGRSHPTNNQLALSAGEQQMLTTIETLSRQYRTLTERLNIITASHPSMICRAVANTIRQVQLQHYQDKILEIERDILSTDSSLVGAYGIVPLASIVEHLYEWRPRFQYLLELSDYIGDPERQHPCSGAVVINKLRSNSRTGYTDLEKITTELSKVAELAWLQQLSTWLIHGTVSAYGAQDFFIVEAKDEEGSQVYKKRFDLLPDLVDPTIAQAIFGIGITLARIKADTGSAKVDVDSSITQNHLRLIGSLELPLQEQQLVKVILQIKSSVSRNVLQHLLPVELISCTILSLQQYFLLEDGEFASCLIEQAELLKEARWHDSSRMKQKDALKALQGLSLKDTEIDKILDSVWRRISALRDDREHDELISFSRKNITLTTSPKSTSRPPTSDGLHNAASILSPTSFSDLLLPSSAALWMKINRPMDLFLTSNDVLRYSAINSYLLAIHRGRSHLCEPWRMHYSRRGASQHGGRLSLRLDRKAWTTCNEVLSFLSQLLAYLNEEVIMPSSKHFRAWALQPCSEEHSVEISGGHTLQRDPEALAQGHLRYLDNLVLGAFLTDVAYTKSLRALLGSVDQVTVLFKRLLEKQQPGGFPNTVDAGGEKEEKQLRSSLDEACNRLRALLEDVIERLHELSQSPLQTPESRGMQLTSDVYHPYKAGDLDHLLIKIRPVLLGRSDFASDDE